MCGIRPGSICFRGVFVWKGKLFLVQADFKQTWFVLCLECVSKIPEYAISGVAEPFLRHKARLSAAKLSCFFLELTQNPLELANFSA